MRVRRVGLFPRASNYALNPADLAAAPFTGEGHRKVVGPPALCRRPPRGPQPHPAADARTTCSRPTARPARRPRPTDGRIVTAGPNLRWATDGAKVWTVDDGWPWLFTMIEHWNAECLGHHVCKRGDRFAAYEPVAQALTHVFGASGAGAPAASNCATTTAANTSPAIFKARAASGASRPASPSSANPRPSALPNVSTTPLKEQIIHGRPHRNRAELAAAVTAFVATYNRE